MFIQSVQDAPIDDSVDSYQYDFTAAVTEIGGWNVADNTVTTITTSAGLFGADLTAFLADCAWAKTTDCDVTDYDNYSGWAIGVNFAASAYSNGSVSSFCITDKRACIDLTWNIYANILVAYTSSVTITAEKPVFAEVSRRAVASDNAFDGWSAELVASTFKE